MKKYYLLLILSVLIVPMRAFSEAPETPPHPMSQMAAGRLEGQVFTEDTAGKRTPLPNQKVTLVVLQNGSAVLKLPKVTDAEGKFQFKNIFDDPSFEYAVETAYESRVYLMLHLHLEKGSTVIDAPFRVGEGSPYVMADIPPQSQQGEEGALEEEEGHVHAPAGPMMGGGPEMSPPPAAEAPMPDLVRKGFFQKIAFGLAGLVAAAALYYGMSGGLAGRSRKPRG